MVEDINGIPSYIAEEIGRGGADMADKGVPVDGQFYCWTCAEGILISAAGCVARYIILVLFIEVFYKTGVSKF